MSDPQFEQATRLFNEGAYREAAGIFRTQAKQWSAQIQEEFYGKNLDAAEIAAAAWISCVEAMIRIPDEDWTDTDWSNTRRYIDQLLDVGKLIKKRYETKVRILYHAAQALRVLGEEDEARKQLSAGNKFYDQQLARYAEPPYPSKDVVQLRELRHRLEDDLLSEAQERTIKVALEAASTEELQLAMEALRTGKGTWVVPNTFRERRTSKDPRAGVRFTATVKVTVKAALQRLPSPEVDLTSANAINAAIRAGVDIWFDGEIGWDRVAQAKMINERVAVRAHRDYDWEFPGPGQLRVQRPPGQ